MYEPKNPLCVKCGSDNLDIIQIDNAPVEELISYMVVFCADCGKLYDNKTPYCSKCGDRVDKTLWRLTSIDIRPIIRSIIKMIIMVAIFILNLPTMILSAFIFLFMWVYEVDYDRKVVKGWLTGWLPFLVDFNEREYENDLIWWVVLNIFIYFNFWLSVLFYWDHIILLLFA